MNAPARRGLGALALATALGIVAGTIATALSDDPLHRSLVALTELATIRAPLLVACLAWPLLTTPGRRTRLVVAIVVLHVVAATWAGPVAERSLYLHGRSLAEVLDGGSSSWMPTDFVVQLESVGRERVLAELLRRLGGLALVLVSVAPLLRRTPVPAARVIGPMTALAGALAPHRIVRSIEPADAIVIVGALACFLPLPPIRAKLPRPVEGLAAMAAFLACTWSIGGRLVHLAWSGSRAVRVGDVVHAHARTLGGEVREVPGGQPALVVSWDSHCGWCPFQLEWAASACGATGARGWALAIEGAEDAERGAHARVAAPLTIVTDSDLRVDRQKRPMTYVIDRDGVVRDVIEGFDRDADARAEALLRELVARDQPMSSGTR